MKGAFSDPDASLARLLNHGLLPDTIYAHESGGTPDAIPDLTYEAFRRFHADYYHPSNAYFFAYGDIATAEYCGFLDRRLAGFTRRRRYLARGHRRRPVRAGPPAPLAGAARTARTLPDRLRRARRGAHLPDQRVAYRRCARSGGCRADAGAVADPGRQRGGAAAQSGGGIGARRRPDLLRKLLSRPRGHLRDRHPAAARRIVPTGSRS